MIIRVNTDKEINLTQLGIELGRVSLRSVAGEWVESDEVDEKTLHKAIKNHVADPNYVDPERVIPELTPTTEERINILEDELRIMKEERSRK